jgi:hypothetical protein
MPGEAAERQPTLEYLARSLKRIGDRAFENAKVAHKQMAARATLAHSYQSSRTLLYARTEREQVFEEAAAQMASTALETLGGTDEAAEVLTQALRELRDRLSDDLNLFYRRSSFAKGHEQRLGQEFLNRTDAIIEGSADDVRHGMQGGRRMKPDAIAKIMTVVSDSPGAVVQSGTGNVQQRISTKASNELQEKLSAFADSAEVVALQPDQRQNILDVVEVIRTELQKSESDPSKLRRWGARLKGIAEHFGISLASHSAALALFSALDV